MSYWDYKGKNSKSSPDHYITRTSSGGGKADFSEFYELEPGLVLDIILDKSHEIFKDPNNKIIGGKPWEADINGNRPLSDDVDYSWIGRVLVRLIFSNKHLEKEKLIWAIPIESNSSEYPLINEIVVVGKYFGKYYYSKN